MPLRTIKENLEESPVLFLTFKIVNALPVFFSKKYFNIILENLDWYRKNRGIKIYAYTILINHLHLVLEFPEGERAGRIIGDFKKFTTKQIIEELKNDQQYDILEELRRAGFEDDKRQVKLWEDNNWPISITTEKFFDQKVSYTDFNATHHEIVKDIETYPYTSYHNHYCEHSVLLETDEL